MHGTPPAVITTVDWLSDGCVGDGIGYGEARKKYRKISSKRREEVCEQHSGGFRRLTIEKVEIRLSDFGIVSVG